MILERNVTAQKNGILVHQLDALPPWRWERRPDNRGKNAPKRYYDGTLFCGVFAWPVEVKMGWESLTDVENLRFDLLTNRHGIECVELRFFTEKTISPVEQSLGVWRCSIWGGDEGDFVLSDQNFNISPCLNWLIGRSASKFNALMTMASLG